ncbi:conserved Plasmodium protein, unknown function [Plasmodium ovale curtisi]|uniref:Uncharacterized protein n=1 Tax=Plasmodium ovale curtisi TaxID=864141 RepID=A0A1A8W638_PLAOA|nr:conserved Plasmodium protein, unknown function [Plasmodium ovale curtisi]
MSSVGESGENKGEEEDCCRMSWNKMDNTDLDTCNKAECENGVTGVSIEKVLHEYTASSVVSTMDGLDAKSEENLTRCSNQSKKRKRNDHIMDKIKDNVSQDDQNNANRGKHFQQDGCGVNADCEEDEKIGKSKTGNETTKQYIFSNQHEHTDDKNITPLFNNEKFDINSAEGSVYSCASTESNGGQGDLGNERSGFSSDDNEEESLETSTLSNYGKYKDVNPDDLIDLYEEEILSNKRKNYNKDVCTEYYDRNYKGEIIVDGENEVNDFLFASRMAYCDIASQNMDKPYEIKENNSVPFLKEKKWNKHDESNEFFYSDDSEHDKEEYSSASEMEKSCSEEKDNELFDAHTSSEKKSHTEKGNINQKSSSHHSNEADVDGGPNGADGSKNRGGNETPKEGKQNYEESRDNVQFDVRGQGEDSTDGATMVGEQKESGFIMKKGQTEEMVVENTDIAPDVEVNATADVVHSVSGLAGGSEVGPTKCIYFGAQESSGNCSKHNRIRLMGVPENVKESVKIQKIGKLINIESDMLTVHSFPSEYYLNVASVLCLQNRKTIGFIIDVSSNETEIFYCVKVLFPKIKDEIKENIDIYADMQHAIYVNVGSKVCSELLNALKNPAVPCVFINYNDLCNIADAQLSEEENNVDQGNSCDRCSCEARGLPFRNGLLHSEVHMKGEYTKGGCSKRGCLIGGYTKGSYRIDCNRKGSYRKDCHMECAYAGEGYMEGSHVSKHRRQFSSTHNIKLNKNNFAKPMRTLSSRRYRKGKNFDSAYPCIGGNVKYKNLTYIHAEENMNSSGITSGIASGNATNMLHSSLGGDCPRNAANGEGNSQIAIGTGGTACGNNASCVCTIGFCAGCGSSIASGMQRVENGEGRRIERNEFFSAISNASRNYHPSWEKEKNGRKFFHRNYTYKVSQKSGRISTYPSEMENDIYGGKYYNKSSVNKASHVLNACNLGKNAKYNAFGNHMVIEDPLHFGVERGGRNRRRVMPTFASRLSSTHYPHILYNDKRNAPLPSEINSHGANIASTTCIPNKGCNLFCNQGGFNTKR